MVHDGISRCGQMIRLNKKKTTNVPVYIVFFVLYRLSPSLVPIASGNQLPTQLNIDVVNTSAYII